MPALAWIFLREQKALENFSLSLLTAALLFSVLWWLQGAVEEGLGMSSAIITALIHSGMPRSVSIISRDGQCVQHAAVHWCSAFVHTGLRYQFSLLVFCTYFHPLCTHQGCTPSPYTLPATDALSFVSQDPVVWKALKCIRDLVNADTGTYNLYSLALAANAFAVAGDKALRQKILKRLDKAAIISGTKDRGAGERVMGRTVWRSQGRMTKEMQGSSGGHWQRSVGRRRLAWPLFAKLSQAISIL